MIAPQLVQQATRLVLRRPDWSQNSQTRHAGPRRRISLQFRDNVPWEAALSPNLTPLRLWRVRSLFPRLSAHCRQRWLADDLLPRSSMRPRRGGAIGGVGRALGCVSCAPRVPRRHRRRDAAHAASSARQSGERRRGNAAVTDHALGPTHGPRPQGQVAARARVCGDARGGAGGGGQRRGGRFARCPARQPLHRRHPALWNVRAA
jgi:hypothetical protein